MKLKLVILVLLSNILIGYSQMGTMYNQLEGWIGLGASSYSGEIVSKVTTVQPAFDFGINYFFNGHMSVNGHLMYSGLTGDDKIDELTRGYSFNTTIGEISGGLRFYLFKEGSKFQRYNSYRSGGAKKINFFISLGAGAIIFEPQAYSNGEIERLTDIGYDKSSYVLPYGGGFSFTFTEQWSAGVVVKRYATLTDYLDDFSIDSQNDSYLNAMLNIIYKVKKKRR